MGAGKGKIGPAGGGNVSRIGRAGAGGAGGGSENPRQQNTKLEDIKNFNLEDFQKAYEADTGKKVKYHSGEMDYNYYAGLASWTYSKYGGEKAVQRLMEAKFDKDYAHASEKKLAAMKKDLNSSKYNYKVVKMALDQFTYGSGPDEHTWSSTEIRRAQRMDKISSKDGRLLLAKIHGDVLENLVSTKGKEPPKILYRGVYSDYKIPKNIVGKEYDFRGVSSWSNKNSVAKNFAEGGGNSRSGVYPVVFVIDNPSKVKAVNIAKHSNIPEESESLIGFNQKFKVVSVKDFGGYNYTYTEVRVEAVGASKK